MNLNDIITKQDILEIKHILSQLSSNSKISEYEVIPGYIVGDNKMSELLEISKSTLHSMKSRGKIPYSTPLGSSIPAYKISDVIDFLTAVQYRSNKQLEATANAYILNMEYEKSKKQKR